MRWIMMLTSLYCVGSAWHGSSAAWPGRRCAVASAARHGLDDVITTLRGGGVSQDAPRSAPSEEELLAIFRDEKDKWEARREQMSEAPPAPVEEELPAQPKLQPHDIPAEP